ncbi:MAG TPA: NAD-dependent protein deacylase [Tissierellaceae bacterium]
MDNKLENFKKIVKESNNIVFFGGAGVSTESNIPDFRSNTGLYTTRKNENYPPEYMLSHSCYRDHPEDFYEYYKTQMIHKDAKPNKAHLALAKLEKMGKLKAVITQNIDGLHQEAGSKEVLELHGSIHRNYCEKCNSFYDLDYIINSKELVPKCEKCGHVIKPDVVLYEEGLDNDTINRSIMYISKADVLIVGGTSLTVYPAAGLIDFYNGDKLVLINKTQTSYDSRALYTFTDSIGEVLDQVVNNI